MKKFPLNTRFNRPLLTTITLLCAGAILLLSAHFALFAADSNASVTNAAAEKKSREAALTVTVSRVEPVNMSRRISVNGAIYAWQEIVVAPEIGGYKVADVFVDVGDRVTKGQELVRLSNTLLEADVASKEAMVKQRQAELVNANSALRRAKSLMQKNVLSEADLDSLNSEALAAQARLDSARADLKSSSVRLQFTHVTAPDAGVITSRTVTVGEIAQTGAEMLRLMRQGRVEWRGEVPESRLAELHAGQKVSVKTADGDAVTGTVRVVAPTITPTNRTGLVYVDMEAGGSARPGMFASGEIEINRDMALMVPLASVVTADGYNYVFVLHSDQTVERRKVEIGMIQNARIEVTKGVSAGELIVDKGAGFLKDGDLVNVYETTGS